MRKSHVSRVSYAILSSELIKMIMNTQITKRWECSGPIIIFRDCNLGQIQFPVFDRWQKICQINGMGYGNSGNQREMLPLLPAAVPGEDGEGAPLWGRLSGHPSWDHCQGWLEIPDQHPVPSKDDGEIDGLGAMEPTAELSPTFLFPDLPEKEDGERGSQQLSGCRAVVRKYNAKMELNLWKKER